MAKHRASDSEILAQIPAAVARAKHARRTEPHAATASYDARERVLHVGLTNGSAFSIPVANVPGLESASDADLSRVRVGPAGVGLRWDELDADLSVAGLAQLVLGAKTLLRVAGAAGGAARSEVKAQAARRNGLKGGRPRKRSGSVWNIEQREAASSPLRAAASGRTGVSGRAKHAIAAKRSGAAADMRRPATSAGTKTTSTKGKRR